MKTSHAIIIGVSLILSFFFLGHFFFEARATRDEISVVGSATKRFDSDIIKWRLTIGRSVGINELASGFRQVQSDMGTFLTMLHTQGFSEAEISSQPINSYPTMNRDGVTNGYRIQQIITVASSKINEVEKLALDPGALTDKGVAIEGSNLEYLFSKLAEIKLSMLAEATKDAKARAAEIVNNSGATLGAISNLKTGVFQINEPYSTEVSDYGNYNTQTKQKDITVTVRATFRIK